MEDEVEYFVQDNVPDASATDIHYFHTEDVSTLKSTSSECNVVIAICHSNPNRFHFTSYRLYVIYA